MLKRPALDNSISWIPRYTLKAPQLQPEPLGLSEESRAYTGMMHPTAAEHGVAQEPIHYKNLSL